MAKAVSGTIQRVFQIEGRNNYVLDLDSPVELNGEKQEQVTIGESKGFVMALQAAGIPELKEGDVLKVVCTGETPPKKAGHSPMLNFAVSVTRGQTTREGRTEDASAPFVDAAFWKG